MIYLRVKSRILAPTKQSLTLGDIATILADASLSLESLPLALPEESGIWRIDALFLTQVICARYPGQTVSVLGDGIGWLHRESPAAHEKRCRQKAGYILRCLCAGLLLFFGSALAIGWFHSDVNMNEALHALFFTFSGKAASHPLLPALPYALGVFLGTGLYFSLFGSGKTSPLLIKLRQYREDLEKNSEKKP